MKVALLRLDRKNFLVFEAKWKITGNGKMKRLIDTRTSSLCRRNHSIIASKKHLPDSLRWNPENLAIDQAFTPPQEWYTYLVHLSFACNFYTKQRYTNQEIYQREQQLLKQYPQYIGHTQQLSQQPGSYFANNILNEPFICLRTAENEIASYFNVCRHHASQLILDKQGSIDCAKGIQCPYHGWTYNLKGQLTKATQLSGIKDFKNKNYGLLSIPHYTLFDTLIFLNLSLSQSHKIFENAIQSVTAYSNGHGFDNNNLIHVYSRKYLLRCNWKVFVENYLDGGYHVPVLHTALNSNLNPDTYTTVIDEHVSFQSVQSAKNESTENESSSVDFAERIGDLGLYTYMYPNFCINRYGKWMDVNYIYPKNIDETYVHFDYFLQGRAENMDCGDMDVKDKEGDLMEGCFYNLHKFGDDDVKFIKESLVASHQVQVEDMMICEAVQRGLNSSAYRSFGGRYAPKLETALYEFHKLYNQDMFG